MSVKTYIFALYLKRAIPKGAEAMFGKNWKTSLAGLTAVLGGLTALIKSLHDGSGTEALSTSIGMIISGIGLLFAKDAGVTGGTIPQTKEAEARSEGAASAPSTKP